MYAEVLPLGVPGTVELSVADVLPHLMASIIT
jgi:hypothetical protein